MSLLRFPSTSVLADPTTVSLLRLLALGCVTFTLAGCSGTRFEAGEGADASSGSEPVVTDEGGEAVPTPSDDLTSDTLPPPSTDEPGGGDPTTPTDADVTTPPVTVVDAGMPSSPSSSEAGTPDGPLSAEDGGIDAVDASSGTTDGAEPVDPARNDAGAATDPAGSGTDVPPPRIDAGEPEASCRADEERGPGGHCYFFSSEEVDWETARDACTARGDDWDLASVESVAEHEWIATRLTTDTWMGGLRNDDQWLWVNEDAGFWLGEEDGEPVDGAFTRWEENEPSGGNFSDQCLRYSNAVGDWYWADIPCGREYQYVCELSPED